MRRFESCDFGPFQLRAILRDRMEPGERLVGWASATPRAGVSTSLMQLALTSTPGLGPVLAMGLERRSKRFVVLTDRRLLVLLGSASGTDRLGSGVLLDAPMAELMVRPVAMSESAFEVGRQGSEPLAALEIRSPERGPARRLIEGLRMISRGGPWLDHETS